MKHELPNLVGHVAVVSVSSYFQSMAPAVPVIVLKHDDTSLEVVNANGGLASVRIDALSLNDYDVLSYYDSNQAIASVVNSLTTILEARDNTYGLTGLGREQMWQTRARLLEVLQTKLAAQVAANRAAEDAQIAAHREAQDENARRTFARYELPAEAGESFQEQAFGPEVVAGQSTHPSPRVTVTVTGDDPDEVNSVILKIRECLSP